MTDDKKLLDYFQKSRNIKDITRQGYEIYIREYTNYFGLSMSDLLTEAELEEEKGVRWKHRKLRKRLIEYRTYLYDRHAVTTAKTRFSKILSFYRHFEIEIHQLPKFNLRNTVPVRQLEASDLLTKEILREAIDICSPVMKAIILFMSSSGCARTETRNLTILDYMKATENYHNGGTIYEIIETLNQITDVVPTYKILRVKTNKYYTTFSSPESVTAINNYLLSRPERLTPEHPLFKIGESYFIQSFIKLNHQLGLGKVGNYNRLRSHSLRKYHATTLMNDGMSRDLVNDLQGRTKPTTDNSYFYTDVEILKKEYTKHLPILMLGKDIEKITVKSKEYLELENQNRTLQNKVDTIFKKLDQLEKLGWEDIK